MRLRELGSGHFRKLTYMAALSSQYKWHPAPLRFRDLTTTTGTLHLQEAEEFLPGETTPRQPAFERR